MKFAWRTCKLACDMQPVPCQALNRGKNFIWQAFNSSCRLSCVNFWKRWVCKVLEKFTCKLYICKLYATKQAPKLFLWVTGGRFDRLSDRVCRDAPPIHMAGPMRAFITSHPHPGSSGFFLGSSRHPLHLSFLAAARWAGGGAATGRRRVALPSMRWGGVAAGRWRRR